MEINIMYYLKDWCSLKFENIYRFLKYILNKYFIKFYFIFKKYYI